MRARPRMRAEHEGHAGALRGARHGQSAVSGLRRESRREPGLPYAKRVQRALIAVALVGVVILGITVGVRAAKARIDAYAAHQAACRAQLAPEATGLLADDCLN